MKKRSILTIALSVVLVAVISVGATLAYMTNQATKVTNTFTVGNVAIKINETDWIPTESHKIQPSEFYKKNPNVENTGSNAAWVRVKVTYDATAFDLNFPTDETTWKLAGTVKGTDGRTTATYLRKEVVASKGATGELFTKATMKSTLTSVQVAAAKLDIDVNADAIQTSSAYDTAEKAFVAFDAQPIA